MDAKHGCEAWRSTELFGIRPENSRILYLCLLNSVYPIPLFTYVYLRLPWPSLAYTYHLLLGGVGQMTQAEARSPCRVLGGRQSHRLWISVDGRAVDAVDGWDRNETKFAGWMMEWSDMIRHDPTCLNHHWIQPKPQQYTKGTKLHGYLWQGRQRNLKRKQEIRDDSLNSIKFVVFFCNSFFALGLAFLRCPWSIGSGVARRHSDHASSLHVSHAVSFESNPTHLPPWYGEISQDITCLEKFWEISDVFRCLSQVYRKYSKNAFFCFIIVDQFDKHPDRGVVQREIQKESHSTKI